MGKHVELIIGAGEVGNALNSIICEHWIKAKCFSAHYWDIILRDKKDTGVLHTDVDAMHICFPFSTNLVDFVNQYVEQYKPKITIIHSTVAVGTTRKINGLVVHSPVQGRHPNLAYELKVYTKHIGYNDEKSLILASGILSKYFKILSVPRTESTELGKLLSLARYGLNIAFAKEQQKMCNNWGLDYNLVVKEFERIRNEGLGKIEREDLKQPLIYPPGEYLGGHCIHENACVLNEQYKSVFLEEIIKLRK